MINLILILGLTNTIIIVRTETIDKKDENKIQELEKAKEDLLKQINVAIDDTVKTLKNNNDTEAQEGLEHMELLKIQLEGLKDMNASIYNNGSNTKLPNINETETRRTSKKKLMLDILDLASVFKKKVTNEDSAKALNTALIRQKLQKWLLQQEMEQEKIRQFREKQKVLFHMNKRENCPRHGFAKKKKQNSGGKKKKKTNVKVPCCRKCCKKSYMGCL